MESHEQGKKIERYVAVSCALHALLFLSFTIGSYLGPKPKLMMPAVQIDVVALPTQVKNTDQPPPDLSLPVKNVPPPPPEPAQPDEPERMAKPEPEAPKAKEKPAPKPREDDLALEREKKKEAEAKKRAAESLKRLKEQLKKEREAEERKKQAALEDRKAKMKAFEQKYRQAIAGNQKNEGTSLSGQMQATLNAYVGAVLDRVAQNWSLPNYLQNKGYRADITIFIDGGGNLVKMEFTRTSGNNLFDNYAEGAVRRAGRFPPPPADLAPGLRSGGIGLTFPVIGR